MSNPEFTYSSTNPFGLNDVGMLASPSFVDIDNDGDLDAFIGEVFGDTFFYRNTGTVNNPAFAAAIMNPFGLKNSGAYVNPELVDIDNDGDLDAFIGNFDGNVLFYRNTGTAINPVFAAAITNPFGLGDVGAQSSPTFVDIDNDGDLDAFAGNFDGNILFFRNTGTVNNPVFTAAQTNPFGLVDVGFQANPDFVDADNDGDLDAFVGNLDGNTLYFQNTGTLNNPVFAAPLTNLFGLTDVDSNANPTFVDINADGDLDAFIGERLGSTVLFVNDATAVFRISTVANEVLTGTASLQDTVTYATLAAAVNVSLTITTQQNTGGGGLDTLTQLENLIGSNFNDTLTGNFRKNVITGRNGNDTIDGKTGADTLIGGDGNEIYFVDNAGDVVIEYVDQGIDQINSSVTFTLPLNVENLTLFGAASINATGNDLNNRLIGNSAANQLNGGDGHDVLNGLGGADTMAGGLGFDNYVVDNVGDSVIENSASGTDSISSNVTYTLPANVENLKLNGAAAINGTGNTQANSLTGNSANNQLNGGGGNDILNGGIGINTLTGGAGQDIFRFNSTGHTDTITDYSVADDTFQLENSIFTALGSPGVLAATKFRIGAQALDADDRIIYNNATGALTYDANGNGAGGTMQIAVIGTGLSMTNADIVVI